MKVMTFNLNELAKNNFDFSNYILGRSFDLGENGAEVDPSRALYYYRVSKDYPLCKYSLGMSYKYGLGNILPILEETADKLLREAYPELLEIINNPDSLWQEKVYAKFATGAYYYYGLGDINPDPKKAFEIIKECADNGHIGAIYDLGYKFYRKNV